MQVLRVLLVSTLALLVVGHALGASLSDRSDAYRQALADLPRMQNPDGGWGDVAWSDSGEPTTALTAQSVRETVLSVQLLLTEETDPYASYRTYDGATASLAASNTSSALGWLRGYDAANGTELASGDHALVALAFSGLGDEGNAHRILYDLIEQEAQHPLAPTDAAQLIIADQVAAPPTNATQNATLAQLGARVNATTYADLEGISWALIAQPAHAERRADLIAYLQARDDLTKVDEALAAWALAASGGPDEATEAALQRSFANSPTGLARAYHLLAERTAYPAFSPLSTTPLFEMGMLDRSSAAREARPSASVTQDTYADDWAAGDGTSQSSEDKEGFPLPVWAMAGTLLFAVALVVVAGLAYGLKKEDLAGPRKDIFEYIEAHPGEHFSKIRRDLSMAPGTFQHHLSVLESEGWITSYRDSRYKRYFVNGNRYQKLIAGYTYKQKFAALANDTTRDFVRFVQTNPGVTQKQVAQRLQIHASTVNWHANRLKQAGILQDQRVGKEVRYTVDTDTVEKMLQNEREIQAAA